MDFTNVSSTAISKVLRMFVNQVLFRLENVDSIFFFTFWNAGILFITF